MVDKGYEATQLSQTLVQRLGIQAIEDAPDVYIRDLSRGQGVAIIGENARKVGEDLCAELEEIATLHIPKVYGAVYKARITEKVRRGYLIELDDRLGFLRSRRPEYEVSAVQVTGYSRSMSKLLLTDAVRIRKGGAEAIRTGRGSYDQHLPKGWRWRRSGDDLENTEVAEQASDIEESVQSPEVPDGRAILQGRDYVELVFGAGVKPRLDEWRRKLTPTMNYHHYLKSLGASYSAFVDFGERVQPLISDKFDAILSESIVKGVYPRHGEKVRITHIKPDGVDIQRWPATVVHSDEATVIVKRNIRSSGLYDGLDVDRFPGDQAVTEFRVGEWFSITTYTRRDGSDVGSYANISTPPEICKDFIRYIDLYVDVVRTPEGVETVDVEQLEDAYAKGLITQSLHDKAVEAAKKAEAALSSS